MTFVFQLDLVIFPEPNGTFNIPKDVSSSYIIILDINKILRGLYMKLNSGS